MIQKKICMLGTFAVGKTSLVRQYVDSIFSDEYQTTLGVKIDKKVVTLKDNSVSLVIWDVQGEEGGDIVLPVYLKGMAAYILVTDPTRAHTVEHACAMKRLIEYKHGALSYVLAINKSDIKEQWEAPVAEMEELRAGSLAAFETSAKTGQNVEEMFVTLAAELQHLKYW